MSSDPRWTRKKELYLGAAALSGAGRERYLDERCPDADLRREVERLLAAGDSGVHSDSAALKDLLGPETPPEGPLAPGTRLGRYRIGGKLGSGGMGWVYEAVDEQLNRPVAIKVLPPGLIGNDEARRRFTREAQATSQLNHPNIVTVYEVGREGGIDFIAMERIQGQTLREMLREGSLAVSTAVRYASQIAAALSAAHEARVVHRDLKPGNIMVTDRGLVKVLDFGLAKRAARPMATPGADEPTDTVDTSLTAQGRVVGTVSYMSPEQVNGKETDARSDIFSFGTVLYEMLCGRRAFREDSEIGTLAAVIGKDPPPLAEQAPGVPRELERLVGKCLRKDPLDRWQHMSDVRLLLEDLGRDLDGGSGISTAAVAANVEARRRIAWVPVAAAAAVGALLTAGAFRYGSRPPAAAQEPPPAFRPITTGDGLNQNPAISRDGRLVAFESDRGRTGSLDIWVKQIGGPDPIQVTQDPADETDPAFSPDGTHIAFRSERDGGGIYVAPALGGDATLLVAGGRNPRFSPDGRWVAYWSGRETPGMVPGAARVSIVDAGGGQPREVSRSMAVAQYPLWSPDGAQLLVLGRKDPGVPLQDSADWWLLPVNGGEPKPTGAIKLIRPFATRRQRPLDWSDGRVLFTQVSADIVNLWQLSINASGKATGPFEQVTRGPGRQTLATRARNADGERIAFSDTRTNDDIWQLPADADRGVVTGPLRRLVAKPSTEWNPSMPWSGQTLTFLQWSLDQWSLVARDMASGRETRSIGGLPWMGGSVASGDGRTVFYTTGEGDIYSVPAAGGSARAWCRKCGSVTGASPDGSLIAFEPAQDEDLMLLTREGRTITAARRPRTNLILSGGRFSQDGRWIAFHSLEQGETARVWIVPVNLEHPVPADQWIAVTDGTSYERDPAWAPGGSLVYFLSDRDGFRCVWARRLQAGSRQPEGDAFAVLHLHTARLAIRRFRGEGERTGLTAATGGLILSIPEVTGSVWVEERRPAAR